MLLDLVPNHTSDRHRWFTERPDYYTWADAPNNWKSIFDGGPAWTGEWRRNATAATTCACSCPPSPT